ncbi:MAG TPA: 4-coumarate--CoA ligase family protein [Vicinamibacterales bacterium]|nr:4-coumarate--CoA ligase family protein [Vicinamibacterales bacterium]
MALYRSPHPALEIPASPLADFVLEGAAQRGDRAALIDATTGRTITYAELPGLVDRAAASLARLGLRKGDVCAIFSPNTAEYPIAVLALARLGAIVTTASPMNTRDDLVKQFTDSRPRFLFTSPAVREIAMAAACVIKFERIFSFAPMDGAEPFASLLAHPGAPPTVQILPADIVALPYSSGTTGLPKGVMLSHGNLVANVLQVQAAGHLQDGKDTLIAFLPFFHIYGLVVIILVGLRYGATLVVMPRFELEAYLELVECYRATMLHVVPPIVLALAKSSAVERRDFSSVRKLFSGAAPLGADVIGQCTARVGSILQQGYGLTETSPATHVTSEDPATAKAGSIGALVPNTECRVVDPATGADVAPGVDGEIWIRGPQVMQGYLNRPEETRATVDAERWLHTGDVGHADADGHFFIVDRLKELIKYKGMQIAPAELEAVLISHPAVADAAVVPQKDIEAGEIPHAFVVLKAQATADELMAYVAARVASYKKIRRLDLIDAIPKSPSGKILRRVLRDSLAAN